MSETTNDVWNFFKILVVFLGVLGGLIYLWKEVISKLF